MSKESGTAQVRNTLWVEMLVRAAQYSAVAQKWIRDSKERLAGRLDTLANNNTMIIGSYDHNFILRRHTCTVLQPRSGQVQMTCQTPLAIADPLLGYRIVSRHEY